MSSTEMDLVELASCWDIFVVNSVNWTMMMALNWWHVTHLLSFIFIRRQMFNLHPHIFDLPSFFNKSIVRNIITRVIIAFKF